MGRRRLYDEDVYDVFDLGGVNVAVYFEAIRYRQQLHPGDFFPFTRADIEKKTDLTYKQQLRAQRILLAAGWLDTAHRRKREGGTITMFRLTELALELTKNTSRRRASVSFPRQAIKTF